MAKLTELAERKFRDLIQELSETAPKHGLEEADICLYGEHRAIVMDWYGATDFIADALYDRPMDSTDDALSRIASRCRTNDIALAVKNVGLTVEAALTDYAARVVIKEIRALREDGIFAAWDKVYAAEAPR